MGTSGGDEVGCDGGLVCIARQYRTAPGIFKARPFVQPFSLVFIV